MGLVVRGETMKGFCFKCGKSIKLNRGTPRQCDKCVLKTRKERIKRISAWVKENRKALKKVNQ